MSNSRRSKEQRARVIAEHKADAHIRVEFADETGHVGLVFEGPVSHATEKRMMELLVPKATDDQHERSVP